eukprot:scaffold7852_cov277-Pinguiococcus_pyrenoidosus.AAC.1
MWSTVCSEKASGLDKACRRPCSESPFSSTSASEGSGSTTFAVVVARWTSSSSSPSNAGAGDGAGGGGATRIPAFCAFCRT